MDGIRNITVGNLLSEAALKHPEKIAVKYNDRDYERTYKAFNEECERVAKGFLKIGIKKGDHVAIWATNRPEWLITLFATAKIGAALVTVNTNYKIYEVEYLLRQSDAKALVLIDGFKDADYVKIINDLFPQLVNSKKEDFHDPKLSFLKSIIYAGEHTPKGMYNFKELYDLADEVPYEEFNEVVKTLHPDEVINIQYTSGTTGFPKGVMLTHNNIINNGQSIGDNMKLTYKDVYCIPVPFFHCFGLVLSIMACVTHYSGMVPVDYFRPISVMKAIMEEKCTGVNGVPTMFIAMLEHPEFEKFSFEHLRTGIMAGSPCPIKVMRQVIDEMGMKDITICYGLTEASPVCTQTTTDDDIEHKVSTIGRALTRVECKIVDPETKEELPDGQPGEFCARGYNIMKGYYKMEEATRRVIDGDGWLHTGDIAVKDSSGYFKITGRLKDMIIRGGENIYPKEIEDFLYTHENISDVQIIGVPSKQYGEEIMACVILKDKCEMSEDEIKEYVRANMARHKTPKYVKFMDAFPMTASGKIQKYKLREMAVEELSLQEDEAVETA